jgi:hypothetical protein
MGFMKMSTQMVLCAAVGMMTLGSSGCKERIGTQGEKENEPYTENSSHAPVPPAPENGSVKRSEENKNPVEPEGPASAEPPGTGSRSDYTPSTR